jgi:hypothetical protein
MAADHVSDKRLIPGDSSELTREIGLVLSGGRHNGLAWSVMLQTSRFDYLRRSLECTLPLAS